MAPSSHVCLQDPYFCNGAVARHLAKLGFPLVHNTNEDFYAIVAAGRVPEHDVLLTNPPYSADHPQRLLDFVAHNGRCGHPAQLALP